MSNPGHHHTGAGQYRPPELIASIALDHARVAEETSERAGQLYMLAEIVAALHRQAEALEARNEAHDDHWKQINQVLPH